jgi:hypothetical protein
MSTQPSFIGSWLVSEYLYTPTGDFAGIIQQRRSLEPLGDVIRVIQYCELVQQPKHVTPSMQATIDIMNQRVGEFVFDLKLVGRARHYLGEDVIGGGFSWRDGVLTAKGMWTRFPYNFTSFSILLNPKRQVTGGKFSVANHEVATIVGVAVPEDEGYPTFQDGELASTYHGQRYSITPDGTEISSEAVTTHEHTFTDKEGMRGNEKQYGALRELEIVTAPGETISAIEVVDHASGSIAGIWKKFRDEKLSQVDVYFLKK